MDDLEIAAIDLQKHLGSENIQVTLEQAKIICKYGKKFLNIAKNKSMAELWDLADSAKEKDESVDVKSMLDLLMYAKELQNESS